MTGRPELPQGTPGDDAQRRDADPGLGAGALAGGPPVIRLGDPDPRPGSGAPPGFDPVWGTLGAPSETSHDWLARDNEEPEGAVVDVEIFGDGFEIAGRIHTGQFARLSDWVNMQTGFIQVRDAWHAHLGQTSTPAPDQRKGTLWVRLDQIVLIADRTPGQQARPGAPLVQKQKRRVSIVTPGYNLIGSIYVHAHGSMKQFLETPDPHFLPITDVTVHWLSDAVIVGRFPFAIMNREQLVTIFDESASPAGDTEGAADSESDDDTLLRRRSGAA